MATLYCSRFFENQAMFPYRRAGGKMFLNFGPVPVSTPLPPLLLAPFCPFPPCIWAKRGRFVIFPVLCLLASGDTALKTYFLLAFGAHKKGCDNGIFRAVFPSIWVSWNPQTLQNKGKRKMTNRPCFTIPLSPPLEKCSVL